MGKDGATMFCKDGYRDYRCSVLTRVFSVLAVLFFRICFTQKRIFFLFKGGYAVPSGRSYKCNLSVLFFFLWTAV